MDAAPVVDALLAAIEVGDVDAARAVYAEDVRVWHNFDRVEQTREENLRSLAWMVKHFPQRRYTDIRRIPFEGGLVQQHVLVITRADGTSEELPAMLRIEVRDDRIVRIEEYLDPAPARP